MRAPTDHDIELVCFDLGRVLVRLSDGWAGACEAAEVCPRVRTLDDAMRSRFMEVVVRHEVGEIDQAGFAREIAELMGTDPPSVTAVSEAWLQGPFPGVPELLAELEPRPVRTACLSNTNAFHWDLMCTPGGLNYLPLERMDHRFASHLIGVRKPAAAIYEHVEREAQVPAERIVFFDDRPENVEAAAERGWHAHQVLSESPPAEQVRAALTLHGILDQ